MKCDICKNKIEEIWLKKPNGTMIKKDSKKHWVCNKCQSGKSKEEILEKI